MYRSFLSVRYFRTRLVNWLSVAGVMLGVAVMIVVWSVFSGFQVEVRRAIRGTLADLELRPDEDIDPPPYSVMEPVLRQSSDVVASVPRLTSYIAHPRSKSRSSPESMGSPTPSGELYHFMTAVGVDWDREVAAYETAKRRSRDGTGLPALVKASEDPSGPFVSLAGLKKWGSHGDYEGAMFSLAFLRRFVGKVVDQPAESFLGMQVDLLFLVEKQAEDGIPDYKPNHIKAYVASVYDGRDQEEDLHRVFFDRALLWRLTAPVPPPLPPGAPPRPKRETPYTSIGITLVDYERADAARDSVIRALETTRMPRFYLSTWEDQRASLLNAVKSERSLLAIVIGFIGLLAGFTILATLTLTVVEKTRDIGVLRALGATSPGVMTVFLLSGALIGVLGAVLGVGLGIVLTESLEPFRGWLKSQFGVDLFPADIYLFDRIPYVFDRAAILWIAGGCMLVSFLASLLPSLRAARMDPVVALRHE